MCVISLCHIFLCRRGLIDLKYTFHWVLTNVYTYLGVHSQMYIGKSRFRAFSASPRFPLFPLPSQFHPDFPTGNHCFEFVHCSWTSYIPTYEHVPFRLASSMPDVRFMSEIHPQCGIRWTLLTNSSSLDEYSTIYFPIIFLKDIWALSSFGDTLNKTVINTPVQVFSRTWVFTAVGYIPRSAIDFSWELCTWL